MFNLIAKNSALIGAALIALLFQTACSQSQVTLTLGLVDAAVETYLNNADPRYAPIVDPYLNAVTAGVDYALTEWKSADSTALKFDKITANFAAIAKPIFPAGTPATAINDIALITATVQTFLSAIQTTKAAVVATPLGAESFAAPATSAPAPKLSRGDKQALPKIAAANAKLKARLLQRR